MAKIKLTENQIAMLQTLESQLPKKKMVKITAEQYDRLFEGDGSYEYESQPNSMKPATNVTKNFKKFGKQIPDENIKFEGEVQQTPVDVMDFGQHVISFLKRLLTDPNDEGIDRFWTSLDVSREQLMDKMFEFNMLGRKIVNGRKMLAIMKKDFVQNIKKLYDDLVPQMEEGMIQFGDDIEMIQDVDMSQDMSQDELFKSMVEEWLQKYTNPRVELLHQQGDYKGAWLTIRRIDEPMRRMGEAKPERPMIKKEKNPTFAPSSTGKPERPRIKQEPNPSFAPKRVRPEKPLIKREGELEEDNYPMGAAHDPSAPWNEKDPTPGRQPEESPFDLLIWHQEHAIFEKDGKYYLYNVDSVDNSEYAEYADREETYYGRDEDGMPDVEYGDWEMDEYIIENYVNDNYKHLQFGRGLDDWENGMDMVEIDLELKEDLMSLTKYIKDEKSRNAWVNALAHLTVSETTTAASSGAFVGKMGGMPIHKGISPADAMNDLDEASKKKKRAKAQQMKQQANKPADKEDKGGLQTRQFTDQEIWDAMRGNVQKDKKKHTDKYKARGGKHKGRRFTEAEVTTDEEQLIDQMQHNNIMHPNLGDFVLAGIKGKMENDSKLSYVIGLNTEKGLSDSNLLYSYDKNTGEERVFFNHDYEKLYDAYEIFDEIYSLVFDELKTLLRPKELQEQGIGGGASNTAGGGAQYATPGFPASEFMGTKGKKGKAPVNKGITHKKTMYPKGKMVKVTEAQLEMIKSVISESEAFSKTQYPEGGFVELDDCTKLNNNKEAQNGGCSVGAVDNVVKTKKSKGSVVSDDALYYEVAQKTGRSIEEVKNLIESRKG